MILGGTCYPPDVGKGLLIAFCACGAIVAAGVDLGMQVKENLPSEVDPSITPAPHSTPSETVAYSRPPGQVLKLDIYRPRPSNRTAAILLLHGGGWVGGSKADMAELGNFIASHGTLAASADYRLAPANRWPTQLEDVQTAVRYLRANADKYNIDPHRVAAVGISAGGQLSLFLGAVNANKPLEYSGFSSRVEAVGSISGLHDLRLQMTSAGERYQIVEALVGERQGPAVDAASPILHADHNTAPTYFVQGAIDPLVPPNQTQEAARRLNQLGVPEKSETVPGMGHGLSLRDKTQSEAFERMYAWILNQLDAKA